MRILACDVGGTKTVLATLTRESGGWTVARKSLISSADSPDLTRPAREFLRGEDPMPEKACIGVAGPVKGRRVEVTNLPWAVDADALERDLGIPEVTIVNDFVALAAGTQHLEPADLRTLNPGSPDPLGTRAVIGAGTGLGMAILVRRGEGYDVIPTEGGHAAFAPTDDLQVDLHERLREEFGRVSVERVLSGPGLVRIYEFLRERGVAPESDEVRRAMARGDPAAAVSGAAIDRADPLCGAALDLFVTIYGAEAGDLALRTLATGGLYVAGGIAPKIVEKLEDGTFMGAFREKGRFADLARSIPVHVVMNPDTPLLGCPHFIGDVVGGATPAAEDAAGSGAGV